MGTQGAWPPRGWGTAAFLPFDPGLGEQDAGAPTGAQVRGLLKPLLSAQRPSDPRSRVARPSGRICLSCSARTAMGPQRAQQVDLQLASSFSASFLPRGCQRRWFGVCLWGQAGRWSGDRGHPAGSGGYYPSSRPGVLEGHSLWSSASCGRSHLRWVVLGWLWVWNDPRAFEQPVLGRWELCGPRYTDRLHFKKNPDVGTLSGRGLGGKSGRQCPTPMAF